MPPTPSGVIFAPTTSPFTVSEYTTSLVNGGQVNLRAARSAVRGSKLAGQANEDMDRIAGRSPARRSSSAGAPVAPLASVGAGASVGCVASSSAGMSVGTTASVGAGICVGSGSSRGRSSTGCASARSTHDCASSLQTFPSRQRGWAATGSPPIGANDATMAITRDASISMLLRRLVAFPMAGAVISFSLVVL